MNDFLNPSSIVIIGASNKRGKVGYALAKNLNSFKGKVFFVNKKKETVFGYETVASVVDIKHKIDLAVIAVPALFVKDIVEECGQRGIKSIIIISAGFSESGHKKEEEEVLEIAKKYNMNLLGPNCFGVVNTSLNLDATFARSTPKKGNISVVSQSGALWSAIADYSRNFDLGFAKFVSLGDMADLGFTEFLSYLEKDKETKVIVLYVEALHEGRLFMHAVKSCKKPVIILKAGRTSAGVKAAMSHTGSLAGSFEIYKAAFRQSGAIIADSLTEALDLAKFLSYQEKPEGKKVLVVTNAGGPGILAADFLVQNNLQLIPLPKDVKFNLPEAWSHGNPVDVLGDADAARYRSVFSKVEKKNFFDSVVIVFTPQQMAEPELVAKEIVTFKKRIKKPVIGCFMGYLSVDAARNYLEQNNVPCFFELERAARVLGKLS